MNKEELSIKDKIYEETKEFGRAQFVDEIYKLQKENENKDNAIKEAIDYLNYYLLDNRRFENCQKQFKRLLQILERTDK